jgi:hypothetical protein
MHPLETPTFDTPRSSQTLPEFDDADLGYSYNRYLAIAARAVRRSLNEDKRIVAERRGEMDLRFAKWSVRN